MGGAVDSRTEAEHHARGVPGMFLRGTGGSTPLRMRRLSLPRRLSPLFLRPHPYSSGHVSRTEAEVGEDDEHRGEGVKRRAEVEEDEAAAREVAARPQLPGRVHQEYVVSWAGQVQVQGALPNTHPNAR